MAKLNKCIDHLLGSYLLLIKPYAAVYFFRCLIKSSAVAESENPPGALGVVVALALLGLFSGRPPGVMSSAY